MNNADRTAEINFLQIKIYEVLLDGRNDICAEGLETLRNAVNILAGIAKEGQKKCESSEGKTELSQEYKLQILN